MSYIIRIYYNEQLYSIDLTKNAGATIGCDSADTITLDAYGLARSHVKFVESKNKICIKGKNLYTDENSRIMSSDEIAVGKRYTVKTEPEINIAIHPKQEDTNKTLGILGMSQITIGRNSDNDIVFKNMRTSGKHCMIYKQGSIFRIKDLNSKNGTYVNGSKVTEKALNDGDVINISIYQIVLKNNVLCFYNTGNDFLLNVNETIDDMTDITKDEKPKVQDVESEQPKVKKRGTVSAFDLKINVNIEEG